VEFNEAGSPWCTPCEVKAADRTGLLHSIAAAMNAVGIEVHSARVTTTQGLALDTFELTDRSGTKLDRKLQNALREGLATGGSGGRRRLGGVSRSTRTGV